jgi:hypothetical protein
MGLRVPEEAGFNLSTDSCRSIMWKKDSSSPPIACKHSLDAGIALKYRFSRITIFTCKGIESFRTLCYEHLPHLKGSRTPVKAGDLNRGSDIMVPLRLFNRSESAYSKYRPIRLKVEIPIMHCAESLIHRDDKRHRVSWPPPQLYVR